MLGWTAPHRSSQGFLLPIRYSAQVCLLALIYYPPWYVFLPPLFLQVAQHPKALAAYKHIIQLIMVRSNIRFDQETSLLADQFYLSLEAASTMYSANGHPSHFGSLQASFKSISLESAPIATHGQDKTVADLIKRVTSCPTIVNTVVRTQIGGKDLQVWRASGSGLSLLSFLYTLQISNLSSVRHQLLRLPFPIHG